MNTEWSCVKARLNIDQQIIKTANVIIKTYFINTPAKGFGSSPEDSNNICTRFNLGIKESIEWKGLLLENIKGLQSNTDRYLQQC